MEEFLHQKVLSQLKVITCTNDIVKIYCAADVAIVFYFKAKFYPTLFLVWTFCNILPRLKLDKSGKSKLKSSTELTIKDLTSVNNNNILSALPVDQSISICTNTCQKIIAIGYLLIDGKTIQNHDTNNDVCLKVLHYHEDELFKSHILKIIPHIIPVLERECNNDRDCINEEVINQIEINENAIEKMDKLLTTCSLKALKYSIKKEMLPILASTFYKKYVMSFCPEGIELDIKKTSFKRLSTFLQLLDTEGIIKFNAGRNGIAEIIRVIETNSKFQDVNLDDNPELKEDVVDEFSPPVKEIYVVTPGLHPIFSEFLCRYVDFFNLNSNIITIYL